jgi:RimJ/RimL family protein N-acetyltransferase
VTQDYSTRILTTDDWWKFSTIRLEALQKFPQFFLSSYETEIRQTPEEWRDWLNQQGKCVVGLYADKALVGIQGVFTWRKDATGATGVVASSCIKPEHQGRGLADKLYESCIEWALGYPPWKKLIVSHREGNEASRRAILKRGFQLTGKAAISWPDGSIADEYNYELDLERLRGTS